MLTSSCVVQLCDSAGVGRTGTFVTIDTEMQRAKHEGTLNPYSYVRSMRGNRNHMVQTEVSRVPVQLGEYPKSSLLYEPIVLPLL